jgi:hypothetical protein
MRNGNCSDSRFKIWHEYRFVVACRLALSFLQQDVKKPDRDGNIIKPILDICPRSALAFLP